MSYHNNLAYKYFREFSSLSILHFIIFHNITSVFCFANIENFQDFLILCRYYNFRLIYLRKMLRQPVELLNLLHQWKMNTLKHVLLKCISSGDKSRKHYQHLAKNIDKYVCYNIFYNNGIISKQVVYKLWINKFLKGTTFKCFRNNT